MIDSEANKSRLVTRMSSGCARSVMAHTIKRTVMLRKLPVMNLLRNLQRRIHPFHLVSTGIIGKICRQEGAEIIPKIVEVKTCPI